MWIKKSFKIGTFEYVKPKKERQNCFSLPKPIFSFIANHDGQYFQKCVPSFKKILAKIPDMLFKNTVQPQKSQNKVCVMF